MIQDQANIQEDGTETELLDALLSEPTIRFGDLMNIIESFERARGSELFFNASERERTQAFFDSCADDQMPKDNAISIIKMLQVEADRLSSESTQDKSDDSIKQVFGDRSEGKDGMEDEGKSVPPSSFKDLQERRRTSNEYRVRGRGDSSSSDGSEMDGIEESLLMNEKEPEGGDLSTIMQQEFEAPSSSSGSSSRPASRLKRPSASRLSINTRIPTSPDSDLRQRAKTAQGVSFPTERILSPPHSASYASGFSSGIPRASRVSDPSRPGVQTVASSSSTGPHPPSSFPNGSPSKPKPRSGRTRSGSADGGITGSGRIGVVPPGAFGMGVGYSAGIGGIPRPPSAARSSRESEDTVGEGDMVFDKHERQSTSNRSQPGLNRPRPPRQTSGQRKQPLPFPRSSSDGWTATPGSPDLQEMRLPDDSMIDDQSFVGLGDLTETLDEYGRGEADISRMGRGNIVDTTMDLGLGMVSMDDVYGGYGVDYGEGVGGRRRKISGERMKRISTDSTSSMVIRAKVGQLEGENQELNNKNRVLEDKLTAQGNDNETMQGKMLDLENNLKDETTEKKRLEREIKQKDRENQTALTELEHKLSTTQEQLRDLRSALTSSTSTNNKLKDEVQDLTRAIRDKEDEISTLMNDLRELKDDKDSLSRDLQDLHQRHDHNASQLEEMRRHNRELKQQLQQQDELQETIGNLNQEVGDLRLRLSHSHARGGTETSTFSAADGGVGAREPSARAKRSLATELDGALDEEEEEEDDAQGGKEEQVEGEDGVTTIYHTTTVRRVVRPRTTSHQAASFSKPEDQPLGDAYENETERTVTYIDRSTSPPPRTSSLMDTGAQTDPALPPYTPRPEGEIVKDALERAHPKLIVPGANPGSEHEHDHDTTVGIEISLEKTAEWAAMYAGLCSEVGIRCEVLERALKERQEGVIARLGEARGNASIDKDSKVEEKEEMDSDVKEVQEDEIVYVHKAGGTGSWAWWRVLMMLALGMLLGWILAKEYTPITQDSFARYLLLHIMAYGSRPDGFVQGSVMEREMGGSRVVWGRVPL